MYGPSSHGSSTDPMILQFPQGGLRPLRVGIRSFFASLNAHKREGRRELAQLGVPDPRIEVRKTNMDSEQVKWKTKCIYSFPMKRTEEKFRLPQVTGQTHFCHHICLRKQIERVYIGQNFYEDLFAMSVSQWNKITLELLKGAFASAKECVWHLKCLSFCVHTCLSEILLVHFSAKISLDEEERARERKGNGALCSFTAVRTSERPFILNLSPWESYTCGGLWKFATAEEWERPIIRSVQQKHKKTSR